MSGPTELWMVLPYQWPVLSPEQIDNDLKGVRLGVETPPLTAYRTPYDALNAGVAYVAEKNRVIDSSNPGSTVAPMQLSRKGDVVKIVNQGTWNTLTNGDKICLYRLSSERCSQPWQETYEGSQEYFTHGVAEYDEVQFDTLRNLISNAGLTLVN